GTLIGDALIAHELAHVAQQSSGDMASTPMPKDAASEEAFETDADIAAVGAVAELWGRTQSGLSQIARNAAPSLRSGLRLRRCSKKEEPTPQVVPSAPSATTTPSPPPTPPEPLRDELDKNGKTRPWAIDKVTSDLKIDLSLLEGGRIFYSGFLRGY